MQIPTSEHAMTTTLCRIISLLAVLIFSSHAHANQLQVGITSSLNKVFQTEPFNFQGQISTRTEIELARNEYEATQLVLFSETDLSDITISITPLFHENKTDVISSGSIQINPVGYVYFKGGEETEGRTGFHPDILLPNQPLNLKSGIPQPVLVTVYASPETKPGRYNATLIIKNKTGINQQIKISVFVHSVLIPNKPRFKSMSLARSHNLSNLWPVNQGFKKITAEQERAIFKKIAEIGFRNYLPPTAFLINGLVSYNEKDSGGTFVTFPTHDRKTGKFDPVTTDEYIDYMLSKGGNSFFIGITSDIYKFSHNSKEREATLLKYLDDLIPHLKKRGVLDQSYLYNIDEPWGEAVDHAKKIYRLVKKRYGSDIHVIQNTNQNNDRALGIFKNYFQAIDINLGFYNITQLQSYRDTYPGIFQDVWWNLNFWPRTRPNLFIEYPLIDARIVGPMSFKFNIQGFEYWELTYIGSVRNYRPVKADDFQLNWVVVVQSLDGLLLYPNEEYGFYSSMRFESFRDGMEDLELLYLLQQLDPDSTLLKLDIVNDIDDYSESIEQYTIFRKELFTALKKVRR
jgi:hypothetical protein